MNFPRYRCLLWILTLASCKASQKTSSPATSNTDHIRQYIAYLADDKLEGRRTGTNGEKLAMEYIGDQFKIIGLVPKGTNGYYQPFDVNDGKEMSKATNFTVNDHVLEPGKDFFTFPYSPNQTIEALPAVALKESDMPWFIDLKETMEDNRNNPHFDLGDYIMTYASKANGKGATAVIYYNTSSIDDHLSFEPKDRSALLNIPVIYVAKPAAIKYFSDQSASLKIRLQTDLSEKKRIGHNVIGYIDNGAATTVVLGAHFDHLGYGEDGNSMMRTGEKLIHNGADDNASGTAALIELSQMLKGSKFTNNNYLFIAFSGEELGLFGSKYFTEHPTIDLAKVDYIGNVFSKLGLRDRPAAIVYAFDHGLVRPGG